MYVRFIISGKDSDSGRRQGIFQALADVREEGLLYEYELEKVKEIHAWFDKNLEKPTSFSKSTRANAFKQAISWYKDSASKHIAKMRELALILEAHGVHVEVIQTERPGYIVYEDEYQVTVEPFYETGA